MATRDHVRFILGGELRTLRDVPPTRTVLDFLRLGERRCGTKEGCAEGDCGACTVVLARRHGQALRYDAVNACIQFLPTLDGTELITVEDLAAPDGTLHPVQASLVASHGSQCGFCTPGFVMSLFALYENGAAGPEAVDEALAGNLCRCTGYAPIQNAAEKVLSERRDDGRFAFSAAETASRLASLDDDADLILSDGIDRFFAPATGDSLARLLLEHPQATLLAGGTDVGLWVTKAMRRLEPVIWLGRARDLARIEPTAEGGLRIGAAATYTDALPALEAFEIELGGILRRIGGAQVRNLGTIGGNIANGSPIGDSPPLLIAMGAHLVLRRDHERRTIPLESYFLDYGKQDRRESEFVEAILLPPRDPATVFRAYKVSKRFDQDISAVMAGLAVTLDAGVIGEARLAFGGMAGTPKRASHAEGALRGRCWDVDVVEDAVAALARDFEPLSDWRASSAYRLQAAGNLLRRFFIETRRPETATRLFGPGSERILELVA